MLYFDQPRQFALIRPCASFLFVGAFFIPGTTQDKKLQLGYKCTASILSTRDLTTIAIFALSYRTQLYFIFSSDCFSWTSLSNSGEMYIRAKGFYIKSCTWYVLSVILISTSSNTECVAQSEITRENRLCRVLRIAGRRLLRPPPAFASGGGFIAPPPLLFSSKRWGF